MSHKLRVTHTIYAGSRLWEIGEYPTPSLPNVDDLVRVAQYEKEQNIPLNERSVVFLNDVVESVEVIDNNDDNVDVNSLIPPNDNLGESLDNNGDDLSDAGDGNDIIVSDKDEDGHDGLVEVYLPKEEFDKLNAKKQKEYINELVLLNATNDEVTDDELYELLNEYQQVAEAKTVKELIAEELAKYNE